MTRLLAFLFRAYLFWMLFFFLNRLLFAVYNFSMMDENGLAGLLPAFFYGMRLDLAMAAYLMVLPLLVYLVSLFLPSRALRMGCLVYFISLVVLISLACTVDLQLFREWGAKINAQALGYMKYPREVLASSASSPVVLLLFLLALQVAAGVFLFNRLVKPHLLAPAHPGWRLKAAITGSGILVLGLSLILMRGGLQLAPLNQSFVYYSASPGANQCAVNTTWNLLYYLTNSGNRVDERKYCLLPQAEADSLFQGLYANDAGSFPKITTSARPNIVLIILESFTADAVASLGGENLAPSLDRLAAEGLMFDSIYASGDRTEKGLAAILSSFPAQPASSILTEPDKFSRMFYLPGELRKAGYHTSFLYGGETEFANIKAYLFQSRYEKITDKFSFSPPEMNSKWGAHDEVVFNRSLATCKEAQTPFFHTLLTLSSHEPFEVPGFSRVKGKDEASLFRNSLLYTDSCLGDYFKKASGQPWYGNTLFIIVADHGHRLVRGYENNFTPAKYRIPLLICGGALDKAYRGRRVGALGSQTDISATLLAQLGLESLFKYSRNLLRAGNKGFAFYSYYDGLGWVKPQGAIAYDFISQSVNYRSKGLPDTTAAFMSEEAKAYMQQVLNDYLKR